MSARDGTFEIRGLRDREYTLAIVDPVTFVRKRIQVSRNVDEDLTIALDRSAVHELIRGRVVDREGHGMRGVEVRFTVAPGDLESCTSHTAYRSEVVRSDDDGSFLIRGVPREGAILDLRGAGILPRLVPIDDAADWTVPVERAARLDVEVRTPSGADRFCALKDDGTILPLHAYRDSNAARETSMPLIGGRSGAVSVSDQATRLIIYRGSTVMTEQTVALKAGALTKIVVQ